MNELTDVIVNALSPDAPFGDNRNRGLAEHVANAVIAAGYRKGPVGSSREELEALLTEHQQEYTSACGLENSCECGHQLGSRGIAEHQAEVLASAISGEGPDGDLESGTGLVD